MTTNMHGSVSLWFSLHVRRHNMLEYDISIRTCCNKDPALHLDHIIIIINNNNNNNNKKTWLKSWMSEWRNEGVRFRLQKVLWPRSVYTHGCAKAHASRCPPSRPYHLYLSSQIVQRRLMCPSSPTVIRGRFVPLQ